MKNRLLLGSVAFGVSFCLSLLVNRNIKTAFLTGLITVPATFSGVVAVNRKQKGQLSLTLTPLQIKIHQLERWEAQLNQFVLELAAEKHRTEANISFLKTEFRQLHIQIAEQRNHKQQLSQDLIALSEQRQQLEALQVQIAEQQNQKQELESSLTLLNRLKPQLEENLHNLRTEIQVLEKSKAEVEQFLSAVAQEKRAQQCQLEAEHKQFEQLPDEWSEFRARVNNYELMVLQVIIQQNEPIAAIKKIAEQNITMPELLIDSINERALDTIGDLIIEPGSELVPPVIPDEYLTNVKKVLKINEIN